MEIVKNQKKLLYNTAVALGNFDGVHIGHKSLIEKCKERAKQKNLKLVVMTFTSELTNLKIGKRNTRLTSSLQKQKELEELGVDILYIVEFNEKIRSMTYTDFIEDIILDKLNAREVFVGFNFRFGFKAKGTPDSLKEYASKGLNTNVIDPVKIEDEIVSSSAIRKYIKQGRVDRAALFLGRYYSMRGKVSRGKGRGKKLGFATANLSTESDYISPKSGVYETISIIDGDNYRSITNIGENPTFGDVEFSIETHIIDFEADLYGKDLEIRFVDHIRDEMKFSSVDELISRVQKDIEFVRNRQ